MRAIPRGWQHPRHADGDYVPLHRAGQGFDDEQDAARLMPSVAPLPPEETEIAAYETVSEGTPISPAFPHDATGRIALISYGAEHETTFGSHCPDGEAWVAILFGSAVVNEDGSVRAQQAAG